MGEVALKVDLELLGLLLALLPAPGPTLPPYSIRVKGFLKTEEKRIYIYKMQKGAGYH